MLRLEDSRSALLSQPLCALIRHLRKLVIYMISRSQAKSSTANMTLQLTLNAYAAAADCNRDTAARRLKRCPRTGLRNQRFALTDVLPRLRERSLAAPLTRAAVDDGVFWCGGDEAFPAARKLEQWLIADADMAERLHNVRVSFFRALGLSMRSASMIQDAERHRVMLPMAAAVVPYIVTGDKFGLPFMGDFARSFAVVHSAPPFESELVGFAVAA